MLKGIPKIISPELLKILCEMGHGDTIVIADGNFPSENYGKRVVRADGISGTDMLKAVLKLIPLDTYADFNFYTMELAGGDTETPEIWGEYAQIAKNADDNYKPSTLERFAFYEEAKKAYCVIATGEEKIYANIILKKGVIK